jgi:hypothetical protein
VTGAWNITYDDTLDVEIDVGGSVYEQTLPSGGGVVTIDHQGKQLSFDLDCARPEILCPSEAWPTTVTAEQRDANHEHQMVVTLPTQICRWCCARACPSRPGSLEPGWNSRRRRIMAAICAPKPPPSPARCAPRPGGAISRPAGAAAPTCRIPTCKRS